MKKSVIMVAAALLLCSCASSGRLSGDPYATIAGADIGGNVGGAIGGILGSGSDSWDGGFKGSAIGTIIGTVAGAVIGNAITTPHNNTDQNAEEGTYQEQQAPQRVSRQNRNQNDNGQYEALPSDLKVRNVRLIDTNKNHILEPDEHCIVIFEVMNTSSAMVYNVVPSLTVHNNMKHIYISPSVMVEQIKPGEGVRYTAKLYADKKLKDGELILRAAVTYQGNNTGDWIDFTLPTHSTN